MATIKEAEMQTGITKQNIKTEEKNGHYFADILQDYKKWCKAKVFVSSVFLRRIFVQHPGR